MKTKIELDQKITSITTKIQSNFPELVKYIAEMPVKISENGEVTNENLEEYYNSLQELFVDYSKTHSSKQLSKTEENTHYADLQNYPASEDIYQQGVKVGELDPNDISKNKSPNEVPGMPNEIDFRNDKSGKDLDIPGSELDDQQENIGSEDEENNYYSLGGDNHNDLEEDRA
ncbi:hypothetical protein [Flavobacterium sp. 7A]|uniref:hypothetical protein n=1 Tax=Flavobacterium sp. 7A TaxID=2940571 RepID=UPI0022274EF3|nr:hypothetical protein [Flavobacterium sp. 7A]MCW2119158.1 hypothetical protein [Flavobacterium sp. 7A]